MSEPNIHRIRLKGPWEVRGPHSVEFTREHLPQDWRALFGEVSGTAIFRRNFHAPTGLEARDQVRIVIPHGTGEISQLTVNSLPATCLDDQQRCFDVTPLLQGFNQLQFSLTFHPEKSPEIPGGLWETVFIEIASCGR